MTDGDKIAAAVMAAGLCSKGELQVRTNMSRTTSRSYKKMSQQEGAAQQRRWNAPKS